MASSRCGSLISWPEGEVGVSVFGTDIEGLRLSISTVIGHSVDTAAFSAPNMLDMLGQWQYGWTMQNQEQGRCIRQTHSLAELEEKVRYKPPCSVLHGTWTMASLGAVKAPRLS